MFSLLDSIVTRGTRSRSSSRVERRSQNYATRQAKKFFSRIQRVIRYGLEMNHCNCRSETAPLRSFEKSARQRSRDIFSMRKNIKFPHFSCLSSRGGSGRICRGDKASLSLARSPRWRRIMKCKQQQCSLIICHLSL
jgi:hypothetical protein